MKHSNLLAVQRLHRLVELAKGWAAPLGTALLLAGWLPGLG
jgi:hypothetical protein